MFEGGIRVPFVVRGPGVAPGSFCAVAVVGWDLLPTIADLAGFHQALPHDCDGVSFKNLLLERGEEDLSRPHGLVFHRYSNSYGHSAIRVGNYKLVRFWSSPLGGDFESTKLFDFDVDPGEVTNLSSNLPEKANELNSILMDYLRLVDSKVAPRGEAGP